MMIMSQIVIHRVFGMVLLLMVIKFNKVKHYIIQTSDTEDYITLGSVFHTVTAISAPECASLCASTSRCQSSMLMGQSCSLHTQSCMYSGERISSQLSSRYQIFYAGEIIVNTAWQDAGRQCTENCMHLVAIESDTEQQAITNLLMGQGN